MCVMRLRRARARALRIARVSLRAADDTPLPGRVAQTPFLVGAPVTASVSQVAAHAAVRQWMVDRQRRLVGERGGVVEGRDIATVVLPQADFKFFLTAAPQERARRRAAELAAEGVPTSLEEVLSGIEIRDRLDAGREVSPLRVAEGAIVIDSTGRSVDDVVDEIVAVTKR